MTRRIARPASIVALVLALAVAPAAFAGKGGDHGATSKASPSTGSFTLILTDSNSNGIPNWGESVTFNVSTSAAYPAVTLTCYQNGDWVTNQTVGFYGYSTSRDFPLSSWKWTGGAADCTATLVAQTSSGEQTLATMSFRVEA